MQNDRGGLSTPGAATAKIERRVADPAQSTERPTKSVTRELVQPTFCLRWNGRDIPLGSGRTVLGRAVNCHVVLDSPLVSRRHARIQVTGGVVLLEDLGSRNGVQVNGAPISRGVSIIAGDRIQLGNQHLQLVVRQAEPGKDDAEIASRTAKTVNIVPHGERMDEERTRAADAFDLIAQVVDKALALGRSDEAERLLAGHLQRLLKDVEDGKPMTRKTAESAATFGVRLAEVTGKAGWVNYSLRVYAELGRPLPMDVVNRLYALLRKIRGVDVKLLRRYVSQLQANVQHFGPAERFAVKRIEGLTALTGL